MAETVKRKCKHCEEIIEVELKEKPDYMGCKDIIKEYADDTSWTREDMWGISPRGLFDTCIRTYEEHILYAEEEKWKLANGCVRSFCVIGCFVIELSIKNFIINKNENLEPKCRAIGHNIAGLLLILRDTKKSVYDSLVKFVEANNTVKRLELFSFEQLVCLYLRDFGDASIRYGKKYTFQDMSSVMLFLQFFEKSGMIDIPPPHAGAPKSKLHKEALDLAKLDFTMVVNCNR